MISDNALPTRWRQWSKTLSPVAFAFATSAIAQNVGADANFLQCFEQALREVRLALQ